MRQRSYAGHHAGPLTGINITPFQRVTVFFRSQIGSFKISKCLEIRF
jgi:hypothetical protein